MLSRIEASIPSLSPAEQRVARLVIQDPAAFSTLPIRELSERAFVSKPTILRFCRSLGYSGFNDFRMKLNGRAADGISLVHPAASADDKVCDVVVKVLDYTLAALQKFRMDVDSYAAARATGVLSSTVHSENRVLVLGAGISALVAQDANIKLRRLGVLATSCFDPVLQTIEASRLGAGDCVLAFSNSGRTRAILELTDIAKRRSAKVVAITSSRSPLSSVADVHLAVDHDEGYGEYSPMVSRLIQMTAVDILVTALAIQLGSAGHLSDLPEIERNLGAGRFS